MKKTIILIFSCIFFLAKTFSQDNDSIKTYLFDLYLKGKLNISVGDSQKILLDNTGKAFFDGKITAREIEVKTNVWVDYVFNTDYNLLPLDKLEKYIKENSKLPEIPCEREARKGINLGNMDALFLKKIEELTLYIINQQKEIEKLKEQLNELKK